MKKVSTSIVLLLALLLNVSAQKHILNYRIKEEFSPANDIVGIQFDSKGAMWVATSYGLYKKEQNEWVLSGAANIYMQSFFIDKHDKIWTALWGEGVHASVDGKKWESIKAAAPSGSANVITADNKGEIWVGDFSAGVLRSGKDKWINYKAGNVGLGDNSILAILPDNKSRMWFGSYHGLSLFDGKLWRLYNKANSKLPDNNVYALLDDAKGDVWIGTCNGLARLSGNTWVVYNVENSGLSSDLILSLGVDAKGNIWAGTNKGVNVFDGKNWQTFNVKNSALIDDRVQVITAYKNAIYLGTSKGIAVFN
ncbi:hypothetical protein IDJ75_14895 [Mucilaginibacter rigui]|uniref:Two component regulator propeller n=1 Tax=Mucilaginibacter rigui TaxID=534635 RepID=A0ABR7X7L6_9SPHI|nr:two-component regulator propeller domain-containing protein [Mucilaginibacter rigui]MBD1386572.1 hypothetical protein [Mucilaginibacter rigui]